jgi:hypothetical protein
VIDLHRKAAQGRGDPDPIVPIQGRTLKITVRLCRHAAKAVPHPLRDDRFRGGGGPGVSQMTRGASPATTTEECADHHQPGRQQGRLAHETYEAAVIDDRPGVGGDLADRLFTRFVHTGDRPPITGSVGLGLAITRLLVEGMEGTVSYWRVDECSRFAVRLRADPQEGSALLPDGIDQPIRASTAAGQGSREPMCSW